MIRAAFALVQLSHGWTKEHIPRPCRFAPAVVCFILCASTAVSADSEISDTPWRVAVGPTVGGLVFDQALADYRWDTSPALQSGAQLMAYRGRFAVTTRLWKAHTTQASGIPGELQVPRVNLTGVDIVGQYRLLSFVGLELWGSAQGGRMHLGYDPDVIIYDVGGLSGPITVEYESISEWTVGYGVELRREFMRQVAIGIQAEQSSFALDTAHRRGSEIIEERTRFQSWNLRLQISWLLNFG